MEEVILVDMHDKVIGVAEKLYAHQKGLLHRAFSILIFRYHGNEMECLLQQRSKSKYHSGGLWTNTCCGHPRPNEELIVAAGRRLKEEIGIETNLIKIGVFQYKSTFTNGLTENEIDHIFIGIYDKDNSLYEFNRTEVETYAWINLHNLKEDIVKSPFNYTSWFSTVLEISTKYLFRFK